MMAATTQEFTEGQEVIWTGTSDLFAQRVTIETARRSWLEIFGETEADAKLRYDIRDPRHGIVSSIPPEQLHPVEGEAGEG